MIFCVQEKNNYLSSCSDPAGLQPGALPGAVAIFLSEQAARRVQAKENKDFGIADIYSSVDKDGDGIDDQTDILQGAREYIATKPVYKVNIILPGYPDDQYGVCTDLVANALQNAGYDLMELVEEDINAHPQDYDIEEPDINIDFRRVNNLKVYFAIRQSRSQQMFMISISGRAGIL